MKLKDLADFVTGLCPAIGGGARIMIYEFRPFYMEVETETLLELEEIPETPEPRRALLFGGVKNIAGAVKEEWGRKAGLVDKKRQTVFGNLIRLAAKKP